MLAVEPPTSGTPAQKHTKGRLLATIGVIGAAAAGLAAFTKDAGTLYELIHKVCQASGLCAADVVPPPPIPQLADYTSAWMDGDHTQPEICGPTLQKYAAQYPKFNIAFHADEARDKDWKGHVTYKYHCVYTATPR